MKRIKAFLFTNTTNRQTVVKNTFWLFVGDFGSRLLKMVLFIYAARELGVLEWGVFAYITAIIGIVITFSDIGINAVLTREISKNPKNSHNYISTSFVLKLILSTLGVVAILTLQFFLPETNKINYLLPLAAAMFFLDSMREFGFALNRAFQKMELEALVKIITNVALVVIGYFLITRSATANSLAWAYIIGGIIGIVIMFVSIRSHLSVIFYRFRKYLLWPIFKEAWPIAVISVFGVLLASIDTLILGWFRTIEDVGLYAAAQKPIQLLSLIPVLFSTALLPIFSNLSINNNEKMKSTLERTVLLVLLVSVPIALCSLFLGRDIIVLLFGTNYIGAVLIFKILVVTVIVSAPGVIISNALFANNKQKEVLYAITAGALSNILLSIGLIYFYGIIGAAIATTISQIVSNSMLVMYAKKIPHLNFKIKSGNLLAASIIMILIFLLFKKNMPIYLLTLSAFLAYCITLIVKKEPVITDIKNIF